MRLDSNKIVEKYLQYVKKKEANKEEPLPPEKWLWHVMDLLEIDKLIKDER